MIFERADIAAGARSLGQRAHDLLPGQVLRVQDPAMAMAALASEIVFVFAAVLDSGEAGAEANQIAHHFGTVAHDTLDRGGIAQPRSRAQSVGDVRLEGVIDAPHARDSALRVIGVGLGAAGLGENGDRAGFRGGEGEHQARDSAADYEIVGAELALHQRCGAARPKRRVTCV